MRSQSKKASALVLALGFSLFLAFLGIYLLEYIIPFSKNIKGIEGSSNAFYQSYAGIEELLLLHSQNPVGYETGSVLQSNIAQDFAYTLLGTGTLSPPAGKGSSEYDTNFNILSQAEPAQFVVGNNRLGANPSFLLTLQIPNIYASSDRRLSQTGAVVLWQLSSSGASLSARDLITGPEINAGFQEEELSSDMGILLDNTQQTLSQFYTTYCGGGNECVLKISIISPLSSVASGNPKIPYLEYQLQTNASIPLRDAYLQSQGKSYGFGKTLKVEIPQTTTNSAFDFTVFQ